MKSINVKCEAFRYVPHNMSKYNDIINQLNGHKCLERQFWDEEEEPHKNTCLTTLLSEHENCVHEILDLISSPLFLRSFTDAF